MGNAGTDWPFWLAAGLNKTLEAPMSSLSRVRPVLVILCTCGPLLAAHAAANAVEPPTPELISMLPDQTALTDDQMWDVLGEGSESAKRLAPGDWATIELVRRCEGGELGDDERVALATRLLDIESRAAEQGAPMRHPWLVRHLNKGRDSAAYDLWRQIMVHHAISMRQRWYQGVAIWWQISWDYRDAVVPLGEVVITPQNPGAERVEWSRIMLGAISGTIPRWQFALGELPVGESRLAFEVAISDPTYVPPERRRELRFTVHKLVSVALHADDAIEPVSNATLDGFVERIPVVLVYCQETHRAALVFELWKVERRSEADPIGAAFGLRFRILEKDQPVAAFLKTDDPTELTRILAPLSTGIGPNQRFSQAHALAPTTDWSGGPFVLEVTDDPETALDEIAATKRWHGKKLLSLRTEELTRNEFDERFRAGAHQSPMKPDKWAAE